MNDYKTLIAFIALQLQSVVPGLGESYRDLHAYFKEKLNNPSNDGDDVEAMAERALKVANLDQDRKSATPSTLDQPVNAHKRACAATLLAMSIIRDTDEVLLKQDQVRLQKMQTAAVVAELVSLLKKGDTVRSTRYPKLELKNFISGGTRTKLWRIEIEQAYGRTHDLLLRCEMGFLPPGLPLASRVRQPFIDYFGDPNAVVDTSAIPFKVGSGPAWGGVKNQPRLTVAREVLRRVCRNFVRQDVRIYFGGRSIDAGTFAYVSGDTNPTKVHVGGAFFTKVQVGLGSEAGTIVHECTHTFAGTKDHKYRSDPCKQLALTDTLKALSNADSYKFFVEAAFG